MLNIYRLFKTPRRNGGERGATASPPAHASSLPLHKGLSPFRLSPHPKRRNTNTSPAGNRVLSGVKESTTDSNHQWKSVDEITDNFADNIGHDLFEPPQLHSTTLEGIFPPSNNPPPKQQLSTTITNIRNKEAVVTNRMKVMHGLDFPHGMPLGPFPSFQELYEKINKWAKDPSTVGGSFTVKKDSTNLPSKFRGPSQKIICSRGGCTRGKTIVIKDDDEAGEQSKQQRDNQQPSQITGCPWEVWTELTTEGWMVTYPTKKAIDFVFKTGKNVCLWHNHEVAKTFEERLVFAPMRELPRELEEFADHLYEGGCMTASEIYTALVAKCRREDIPITFIQSDIKNRYKTYR